MHAMPTGEHREHEPIEKSRSVPEDDLVEVEESDFLRQRQEERRLAKAVTGASEEVFAKVWDNPDDAEYDRLSVRQHRLPSAERFPRPLF
jgi:hypothetical protein